MIVCDNHPIVDFEEVTKIILMEELEEKNKYMIDIEKFGDIEAFWLLLEEGYGYDFKEKNLRTLATMFLITHNAYFLKGKLPAGWKKYLMKT